MSKKADGKQQGIARAVGRYCTILTIISLAAPGLTLAQDTSPGATNGAAQHTSNILEEIIVTARRRDEDNSRVPIAITALGSKQILTRMIQTDSDLQSSVPGLTIRQTQGNNSLTYSIRGQSADTFSGSA
jgi:iron complex outermembrane receptor protein